MTTNVYEESELIIRIKGRLIQLGEIVLQIIKAYIDLNIHPKSQSYFLTNLYKNISNVTHRIRTGSINQILYDKIDAVDQLLYQFLRNNLLDTSFEFLADIEALIANEENIIIVEKQLNKLWYQVNLYMMELKKYQNLFLTVNEMRPIRSVEFAKHNVKHVRLESMLGKSML